MRTLFLAIFQNAKRHGGNKGGDDSIVTIYVEGDCLCISNNVEERKKKKLKKQQYGILSRRRRNLTGSYF